MSYISRLPTELLARVIEATEDPVFQWCVCLDVSHQFRAAVYHLFSTKVLPATYIDFDLDWEYIDQENMSDKCLFYVKCEFVGFKDEAKEIAVFKDKEADEVEGERGRKISAMLKEKWEEVVTTYSGENEYAMGPEDGRFDLPPWLITVKAAVNDTELPGYKVDYANREISFRWKEAYQCFFREENYITKEVIKLVNTEDITRAGFNHLNAATTPSAKMARMIILGRRMGDQARSTARKQIRRYRIIKHLKTVLKDFDPDSWFDEPSEDDIMLGFDSEENVQLKKISEHENVMSSAWKAGQGDPIAELFAAFPMGERGSDEILERLLGDVFSGLNVSGESARTAGQSSMFQFNAGARPMQPMKRQRTMEGWVQRT